MSELEPITKALLRSWSPEQLTKEMKNPARLDQINAFLRSPEAMNVIGEIVSETNEVPPVVDEPTEVEVEVNPAVVEFNQAEADAEAARLQAAQVVADAAKKVSEDQARMEAEEMSAAGITAYKDASGNIVKLVQEYQADDENGNPIGRPTHLEARSWVELVLKQRQAHTQATRAFHRLKDQKTTFKPKAVNPIPVPNVPLLTEAERIQAALDLNSDDENVVIKADRKLRADQILKDQRDEAIRNEEKRQREVSLDFLQRHKEDYFDCEANKRMLIDYIREHDLVWTTDNLELAFAASEPQLVPIKAAVVEETEPTPVNPVVVPQAVEPAAPVPVINPVPAAVAVVQAQPAEPNTPATPRRGVNAGLQPGQTSGRTPITVPTGLTMRDIWKWTSEQMRKERMNPARRAEIDRVIAAHNKANTSRV